MLSLILVMLVEILVSASALSTFLVGWPASALSWHQDDITFAHLAYPLMDVIITFHQ